MYSDAIFFFLALLDVCYLDRVLRRDLRIIQPGGPDFSKVKAKEITEEIRNILKTRNKFKTLYSNMDESISPLQRSVLNGYNNRPTTTKNAVRCYIGDVKPPPAAAHPYIAIFEIARLFDLES